MKEEKTVRVEKFYNSFVRIYDLLKIPWNKIFSQKAEKKFSEFLINNLDQETSVLELGCGTGVNLEKIYDLDVEIKNYIGVDITPNMLKKAKSKFPDHSSVTFVQEDLKNFVNEGINTQKTYDIILCVWVLSHLENQARIINQVQELLSEKGKVFLIFLTKPKWYVGFWMTPFLKWIFSANYVPENEIRQFNNVSNSHRFSAGMVSVVEISKEQK